ncbi:hypothetical protein ONE63_010900 [Megalurothrips usitatus]|uniref:Dystrophin-like n=1 Tax=Megalurothrips usitatus TaxID=439358 RepID=A0AAV7XIK3_9NEOP|nr:hypothetical protein ONE63_010900 [Megalurothrips usitatus]
MDEWWDRADMECGMPYYINHRERKTQWDHPKYMEIINLLRECNVIKYAAYRTAAKLCVLQRTLHMEQVRMGLVVGVLDQHRLRAPENGVTLEIPELEAVLADMFFASRRENMSDDDVDLNSELLLNFLLNAFDDKRKNGLTVLQVKVALILLSHGRLQDKHQYLFHQVADHNNCISRRKLDALLRSLALITEYLSEGQSFGPALVAATVDSCFQLSQGTLGVTEDGYMSWLLHEPQLLVWLSTFYRMRSAELVWHNVKCAVCKAQPIRGLRYRCLRCMGYEQCQTCFLTGKTNRKHKLSHPMQEYVGQTSSMEATRAFLKVLKNKVCRSNSKIQYLPVLPQDSIPISKAQRSDERGTAAGSCGDFTRLLDGLETTSRTVLYGSTLDLHPGKELQSIISQLEQLCAADEDVSSNTPMGTRSKVEAQVQRLKMLKRFLTLRVRPQVPHRTLERLESTPLVYAAQRNRKPSADHFSELSPIPMEKNSPYVTPREIQVEVPGPREFGEGAEASADDSSSLPSLTERHPGDISTWLGNHQSFAVPKKESFSNIWLSNSRLGRVASNTGDEPSPSSDSRSEAQSDIQSDGQSEAFSDVQRDRRLEELHKDLDTILDRLQNMLASNFAEDPVNNQDNEKLQLDAIEIEDLLSGLIEGVENQQPPLNDADQSPQEDKVNNNATSAIPVSN